MTGAQPFITAVQGDITPEMSLGQAAAAMLSGSDDPIQVLVNLSDRTVKAYNVSAPLVGLQDAALYITPDDAAKVTTWVAVVGVQESEVPGITAVALETPPGPINADYKPSRSLASLISVIEDKLAAAGTANARIVVNQVNETVTVWGAADAPLIPGNVQPVATATQSVVASTGVIKNAFE